MSNNVKCYVLLIKEAWAEVSVHDHLNNCKSIDGKYYVVFEVRHLILHSHQCRFYYKSSIGFDRYNSIDSNSINLITYLEISNAGNMNRNWPKTKNIESIHVEAATLKQLFHILVTG